MRFSQQHEQLEYQTMPSLAAGCWLLAALVRLSCIAGSSWFTVNVVASLLQ
jgi:hypothetical protein